MCLGVGGCFTELTGVGRLVCALVPFNGGWVVVVDIHYELEASHDGR